MRQAILNIRFPHSQSCPNVMTGKASDLESHRHTQWSQTSSKYTNSNLNHTGFGSLVCASCCKSERLRFDSPQGMIFPLGLIIQNTLTMVFTDSLLVHHRKLCNEFPTQIGLEWERGPYSDAWLHKASFRSGEQMANSLFILLSILTRHKQSEAFTTHWWFWATVYKNVLNNWIERF